MYLSRSNNTADEATVWPLNPYTYPTPATPPPRATHPSALLALGQGAL